MLEVFGCLGEVESLCLFCLHVGESFANVFERVEALADACSEGLREVSGECFVDGGPEVFCWEVADGASWV